MFWRGTLMRSCWQVFTPQSEEMSLLGSNMDLKIILFPPLSNLSCSTVFIHSDQSASSRSGLDAPELPLRKPCLHSIQGLCHLLCKAPFSSWLLPPAWAGLHLISWPERESVQISKLGTGAPRDRMDKEQWAAKPHLPRRAAASCPSSLVIANGHMGSIVPELLILTSWFS